MFAMHAVFAKWNKISFFIPTCERTLLLKINALKIYISGNTYPFDAIEGLLESLF